MRSALFGVAIAATLSAAANASPVEGLWRAPVHEAVIEVYDCGAQVCGRLVSSDLLRRRPDLRDSRNADPSARNRPIKNLVLMSGFAAGPSEWKGGDIYNPEDGRTYHASLTLADPTTLKLTGCIVFPLCRTQTWRRAAP